MKKKELKELRTKDMVALRKALSDRRKEISEKGMSASVRNLRRDVAQILTLIREKEIIDKINETKPE